MPRVTFDERDREDLRSRGIDPREAERQLSVLSRPRRFLDVVRPCTVGDGIRRIVPSDEAELLNLHESAARDARLLKFVPASGAASRMFQDLLAVRREIGDLPRRDVETRADEGHAGARALLEFVDSLGRFAFAGRLVEEAGRRSVDLDRLSVEGPLGPIVDLLAGEPGLGYASLPKALIPFHVDGGRARTALEQHLLEAVETVRDARGRTRIHFTVSPEHEARCRAEATTAAAEIVSRLGAVVEASFSFQRASTDTLAATASGEPFRTPDGRLLFRPGGHGSLLENLRATGGDVALVKNIDNVQPSGRRAATVKWKRLLAGLALKLQAESARSIRALMAGDAEALAPARRLAASAFQRSFPEEIGPDVLRERLLEALLRPIRVCGVVRNTGEPGGGPFWVRDADGHLGLQIVEGAEIDLRSRETRRIWESSTYFNPVDLACVLRRPDGRPFDLAAFVDPDAVIVTTKSSGGTELRALERPGLWNGAMARWNTVFVEVPLETFTPVKTLGDLLRPEHAVRAENPRPDRGDA